MAQGSSEVEEGSVRTDDIRSQIEQTRAEMSETIDAIQTRLSPTHAIAHVKDSVTDATVGRLQRFAQRTPGSGRSLLETARNNPLPVALVTTVAVGLMARAMNHRRRRRAVAARMLTYGVGREQREPGNGLLRHRNRRVLAAASAGAAGWAIWRAQTPASRPGSEYPTGSEYPKEPSIQDVAP